VGRYKTLVANVNRWVGRVRGAAGGVLFGRTPGGPPSPWHFLQAVSRAKFGPQPPGPQAPDIPKERDSGDEFDRWREETIAEINAAGEGMRQKVLRGDMFFAPNPSLESLQDLPRSETGRSDPGAIPERTSAGLAPLTAPSAAHLAQVADVNDGPAEGFGFGEDDPPRKRVQAAHQYPTIGEASHPPGVKVRKVPPPLNLSIETVQEAAEERTGDTSRHGSHLDPRGNGTAADPRSQGFWTPALEPPSNAVRRSYSSSRYSAVSPVSPADDNSFPRTGPRLSAYFEYDEVNSDEFQSEGEGNANVVYGPGALGNSSFTSFIFPRRASSVDGIAEECASDTESLAARRINKERELRKRSRSGAELDHEIGHGLG
jgi:hypothetical protein